MSNRREDLTFRWGIDADAFRRQLTRINADVQKSTDGIKGRLAEAFTISAAAIAFKEIGEAMLELRRKSDDLGASVEFLQGVGKLSTFFGGSVERTDAALQNLTTAIGTARTEGGPMVEVFERFGISLYNVNGTAKTTEEVFKNIADAYKNSTDASTKAALAFEFFGKTGKDINNILDMGGDGIDSYVEKSNGLGIVAVENVTALADAWLSVKAAFQETGVFANALGWISRVTQAAAATLGAMAGGASLGDAQAIAGQMDLERAQNQQERDRNAQQADAAMRAARQREQIAKAAESFVSLSNQSAEIEGKRRLLGLTMQELNLRARLIAMPDGSRLKAAAERDLLNIIAKRGAQERQMQADKLALLQMEERQVQAQLDRENDALKRESLLVELKKKQNEVAAQGLAIADEEAKRAGERNRLMADQQSVMQRKEDRTKYTLAELAGADIRGMRRLGVPQNLIEDAMKAKEVERLTKAAEFQRFNMSNPVEAEKLFSQAERIKATIGSLQSTERLNDIATAAKKTVTELEQFNATLKNGEGRIKVLLAP